STPASPIRDGSRSTRSTTCRWTSAPTAWWPASPRPRSGRRWATAVCPRARTARAVSTPSPASARRAVTRTPAAARACLLAATTLTPAAATKDLVSDLPDDKDTRDAFTNQLHKTSPLIRWTAPFAGHVLVSGGAQLVTAPAGTDPGDGIIATVNKTDDEGRPP